MSTFAAATVSHVSPGEFRLSLLGRFALERDGRAIRLPTRKEEGLLAYLVLHPGSHPRESLAERYWGDTAEPQARASLRAALAGLRAALGPSALLSDRETVQFNPELALNVDVVAFQAEVARFLCDPAVDPSAFDPALYHGDLLAGHYDDWVLTERERLRQLYLDALLHLVARLRALSRSDAAIAAARRALAVDPAEERAHRHLIYLLAVTGNRPAALRQFELCRRSLREELDVEPSPETIAVLDSIDGLRPEGATAAPAPPTAQPNRSNLPVPLTSFVGRKQEIAALSSLLGDNAASTGGRRLVTLTGAGGSGKTRLAIQVATLLGPSYGHGAWWVDLSSLRDPALVPDAALRALGMTPAPGQPAMQTLVSNLRERSLLLVLDNCEHLLEACAQLAAALLLACPNVRILTTSRQPLEVPGEQLWPVPTFSVPAADGPRDPEGLLGYDAVRLFLDRARMHRPEFGLSLANATQVAEICRRLDGIPLAIELAAARVRMLEADEILARLQNRLRLLASGSALSPPRHQTLRASIDWSYNLLSPAECVLLQRLAVFVGGCTLAAAEAVCADAELAEGQILDLLARLVDRSLVVVEGGRYRLLETIREYAGERLVDSGEADALRERQATYFAAWLGGQYNRIQTREQRAAILDIAAEMGNIRAAWGWAAAARRGDLLRSCSDRALIWYCELRSQFQEGEALFARTAVALSADPAADPGPLALLRAQHGHLLGRLGRLAEARQELEEACARLRQVGSAADLGQGLTFLGMVAWHEGEFPRAQALLEEALELNRASADTGLIGLCLFFLGLTHQATGEQVRADACFGEALALGRKSGSPRLTAITAVHSVPTVLALGRPGEAMERLREGLTLARATEDRWLVFAALGYLGRVLGAQGDYGGARTALEEALALATEVGNRHDMAWAEAGLADGALTAGDLAQADTHYRAALGLAVDAAAYPKALYALAGLAMLRAQTGGREEALELARHVLRHPASNELARARAAKVVQMLNAGEPNDSTTGAGQTFEQITCRILGGG